MNLNATSGVDLDVVESTFNDGNSEAVQSLLQTCRFYLEGVLLTPVAIIGIIGNVLSIFVLSCPEMQSNFNHLLLGLASFDFVYLLVSLLIFALPKLSLSYLLFVLPYIMPIGYGFAHIGRVGSVLMTLSVTLERFFAIVYPLKRVHLKTFLILMSVGASVIYNIPRFFEFKIARTNVTEGQLANTTVAHVAPTDLRGNRIYVQVYVVWMKFIIVELFPYVAILLLNAIMLSKIRRAMRQQKAMTCRTSGDMVQPSEEDALRQRKELSMAIVLVCIVVMFIVCQSVKIIPDMYEALTCDHSQKTPCKSTAFIELLISISHLLLAVNSASNFIIYMLRGDKFRQVFIKVFVHGKCYEADRRSPVRSMSTRLTTARSTTRRYLSDKQHHRETVPLVVTQNGNSQLQRSATTKDTTSTEKLHRQVLVQSNSNGGCTSGYDARQQQPLSSTTAVNVIPKRIPAETAC